MLYKIFVIGARRFVENGVRRNDTTIFNYVCIFLRFIPKKHVSSLKILLDHISSVLTELGYIIFVFILKQTLAKKSCNVLGVTPNGNNTTLHVSSQNHKNVLKDVEHIFTILNSF